jgi:hypothetical protein
MRKPSRRNTFDGAIAWELGMLALTKRVVLPELSTTQEIAAAAGLPLALVKRNLRKWKDEGRIFAVEEKGTGYYPFFALDPRANFHPYPAVAEILSELRDLSPFGIAAWFVGVNSFLDDQRPKDILDVDPAWVIDAAKDEADKSKHG